MSKRTSSVRIEDQDTKAHFLRLTDEQFGHDLFAERARACREPVAGDQARFGEERHRQVAKLGDLGVPFVAAQPGSADHQDNRQGDDDYGRVRGDEAGAQAGEPVKMEMGHAGLSELLQGVGLWIGTIVAVECSRRVNGTGQEWSRRR